MIIKNLINRNVNFVVVQYYSWLKSTRSLQNKEWEILIPKSEAYLAKGIFLKSAEGIKHTKSRILTLDEITEFRELLPQHFVCAIKNSDGAVYELKDKNSPVNNFKLKSE